MIAYLCPRCCCWHAAPEAGKCSRTKRRFESQEKANAYIAEWRANLDRRAAKYKAADEKRKPASRKPIERGKKRRVIRKGVFPGQHLEVRS